MPGVRSIVWSECNKAKLLDALLFYNNVRVDNDVANSIAQHVGCTSKAIHSILQVSKRNFRPLNGARKIPVQGNVRVAKSTKATTPAAKKVKPEAEDLVAARTAPCTPPETPIKEEGHGFDGALETPTKRRSTPRTIKKCDYIALNGNSSDSEGEPSEEDSQPTDAEFSASKDAELEDDDLLA